MRYLPKLWPNERKYRRRAQFILVFFTLGLVLGKSIVAGIFTGLIGANLGWWRKGDEIDS